jgi:hypothetical protein
MKNTSVKCNAATNVTKARLLSCLAQQALLTADVTEHAHCPSTVLHLPMMIPSLHSVWRCEILFEDKRTKSHIDLLPTLIPFQGLCSKLVFP